MNETVQVLKLEIQPIKKTQAEGILEMEKFRNSNKSYRGKLHQQNTRDGRISGVKDTIKEMDTLVKENVKSIKLPT